MTLTTTHNRMEYTASAAQTVFPYTFLLVAAVDMEVWVDGSLLITGYTISGVGLGIGGNVTIATPVMAGGELVVLLRSTDTRQQVNLLEGGDLPADSVEGMFDQAYAALQDLSAHITRVLSLPPSTPLTDLIFPGPGAGLAIRWNAAGTALETFTILPTDIASPITSLGDLLVGGAAGAPSRLAVGAEYATLQVRSGQPAWSVEVFRTLGGTVTNTAVETTVYTGTIPALLAGRVCHMRLTSVYFNDSGASRTFTVRIKVNSTTVVSFVIPTIVVSSLVRALRIEGALEASTDTAQGGTMLARLSLPVAQGDAAVALFADLMGAPFGAEDLTVPATLTVTVQHSAADLNLSWFGFLGRAWIE